MVIRLLTIIIGCRNPTNLPRAVWDSDPEAAIVSYLSTLDLCLRFYHLLFVSLLLSFAICQLCICVFFSIICYCLTLCLLLASHVASFPSSLYKIIFNIPLFLIVLDLEGVLRLLTTYYNHPITSVRPSVTKPP